MDQSRRSFLRGKTRPATAALRPPWALVPDDEFLSRCTRCGECSTACPRGVIRIADGGYPEINFAEAGCSLCGDCARSCEPGALDPGLRTVAFAWKVAVSPSCLNQKGVECRICGDACDARALQFQPMPGGIARLSVKVDECTGCGECLAICPVQALGIVR